MFHILQERRFFTNGKLLLNQNYRIGFVIGYIVSAVMVNVIQGAVNTLIVCWADSPSRLEENHPELAQEMRDAWRAAFPAEADVQAEAIATPASGTPVYGTVPAIVL
jgi:hypothetical protein